MCLCVIGQVGVAWKEEGRFDLGVLEWMTEVWGIVKGSRGCVYILKRNRRVLEAGTIEEQEHCI